MSVCLSGMLSLICMFNSVKEIYFSVSTVNNSYIFLQRIPLSMRIYSLPHFPFDSSHLNYIKFCYLLILGVKHNVSNVRRNLLYTLDSAGELVYKPVSHRYEYQFILGLQSTHTQTNMKVNIYL